MAKAKRVRRTKQEQIDEAVELLGKIEHKEAEVETATRELKGAREEAKTKKGVWLTKVDELRHLCRTRKRWAEEAKRQPLLNAPLESLQAHTDKATTDRLEKLRDAGLPTVGDLADRMEQQGNDWAKGLRWADETRQGFEDAVGAVRQATE